MCLDQTRSSLIWVHTVSNRGVLNGQAEEKADDTK